MVSFLCNSAGVIIYSIFNSESWWSSCAVDCEMNMVGPVIDKDANGSKPQIARQLTRGDGAFGSTGKWKWLSWWFLNVV